MEEDFIQEGFLRECQILLHEAQQIEETRCQTSADIHKLPCTQSGAQELPCSMNSSSQELPNSMNSGTKELPHSTNSVTEELPHSMNSGTKELPHSMNSGTEELPHSMNSGTNELPHSMNSVTKELPHSMNSGTNELQHSTNSGITSTIPNEFHSSAWSYREHQLSLDKHDSLCMSSHVPQNNGDSIDSTVHHKTNCVVKCTLEPSNQRNLGVFVEAMLTKVEVDDVPTMQNVVAVSIVTNDSNSVGITKEADTPSTVKEEVSIDSCKGDNSEESVTKGDNLSTQVNDMEGQDLAPCSSALILDCDEIKREVDDGDGNSQTTKLTDYDPDLMIKTEPNIQNDEIQSRHSINKPCDQLQINDVKQEADDGRTWPRARKKRRTDQEDDDDSSANESDMYIQKDKGKKQPKTSEASDVLFTVRNISHLNKFQGKRKIYQLFTCKICEKTFNYQLCVENHIRTHTGERPFECNICHKKFVTRSALNEHEKIHRGEKNCVCHLCGASFRQNCKLNLHMKKHNGEFDFKCETCGRSFLRKDHYNKHRETHKKDRSHVCKECGKGFNVKSYLQEHIRRHHLEKAHKCEMCDAVYHRKDHLDQHKLYKHFVESGFSRMVQCDRCGVSYTNTYINSHKKNYCKNVMRKEYRCKICNRGFITEAGLQIHQATHTSDGKIECNQCNKVFFRSSHYEKHLKTHQGLKSFKCEICSKDYATTASLRIHKLTHNTERNYPCEICGLSFVMADYLKKHMVQHRGKNYKCELCSMSFFRIDGLKRHFIACQRRGGKPRAKNKHSLKDEWVGKSSESEPENDTNWSDMELSDRETTTTTNQLIDDQDRDKMERPTRSKRLRKKKKITYHDSDSDISDTDKNDYDNEYSVDLNSSGKKQIVSLSESENKSAKKVHGNKGKRLIRKGKVLYFSSNKGEEMEDKDDEGSSRPRRSQGETTLHSRPRQIQACLSDQSCDLQTEDEESSHTEDHRKPMARSVTGREPRIRKKNSRLNGYEV